MKKLTRYQRMLPACPRMASWIATDSVPSKWQLLRKLGKDILSNNGQETLEWIIFYDTIGNKKVMNTASYFDISRKTLHKYLYRFDDNTIRTLEEHSRRPKKIRGWMLTHTEEANIIDLRKRNMEYGKAEPTGRRRTTAGRRRSERQSPCPQAVTGEAAAG